MELQFDLDFSELKEEFKKLDEIKKDIKEIKSDEKSDSLATALEGYTNKVNDIIKIIVKELSNKEVTVKGIKDTSEILGKINENIKNIKLPKTDFSGISESIKSISFDELNKSLGEILKNLNIP
ncbi:MAG TPA: hypothetical protein ENG87_02570, partial [Candidatus Pacearchaeota archaeon]|nr:hypothetical protein [Candidatus Pacearchaeota archaeon]